MAIKISKKIKSYAVGKPEATPAIPPTVLPDPNDVIELQPKAEVIQMHEKVERPAEPVSGTPYTVVADADHRLVLLTLHCIPHMAVFRGVDRNRQRGGPPSLPGLPALI